LGGGGVETSPERESGRKASWDQRKKNPGEKKGVGRCQFLQHDANWAGKKGKHEKFKTIVVKKKRKQAKGDG